MTEKANRPACIYARVSDAKQKVRGDGLGSQETRCREFASFRSLTFLRSSRRITPVPAPRARL